MRLKQVPFFSPASMHAEIRAEVLAFWERFYDSNWYILGEEVEQFERAYAAFSGVRHCVGVANGLDALQIALRALGIGPGDEVIVPSNTYIASWLAVGNVGAVPVPVEPDPGTWNIDPAGIEAACTARTRAVMPVHLYGQPCAMDRIGALAEKHGLFVVEDNAQAHGARFQGRRTGSFGQLNATSFYPSKNLGALGDAGALTTDLPDLADFAATYRNYGSRQKYFNELAGVNSRLDPAQAGILNIKLRCLETWNRARAERAAQYLEELSGLPGLQLPVVTAGAEPVWHLFVVQTPRREALQNHLKNLGIQTMIHYPLPPHLQKAYAGLGFRDGQFPLAERLARECLSLPMYPGLEEGAVAYVCEAVRSFLEN